METRRYGVTVEVTIELEADSLGRAVRRVGDVLDGCNLEEQLLTAAGTPAKGLRYDAFVVDDD